MKENNTFNKYLGYVIGQGIENRLTDHLSLSGDVAITRLNNESEPDDRYHTNGCENALYVEIE